jgi:uncharacterized protein YgiM (DUF1202 family)
MHVDSPEDRFHDVRTPFAVAGFTRRALAGVLGLVAGGLATVKGVAGQEPPPIEPRGGTVVSEPEQIIEPEVEPTISPDENAETVTEMVGTGSVRYFAETGHNLDEPFLAAWTLAGGEAGPGLPISEPRYAEQDGGIRQDFEAMAFVFKPDAGEQGTIEGADLPLKLLQSIVPGAGSGSHSVSGAISAYWNNHGAAQLLGQPISEAVTRTGTTTQAFEHAVLDVNPSGTVSMRPVNREAMEASLASDEAFQPTPPTRGTSWLVTASDGLLLRSGATADAPVVAVLPDNAEFIAVSGEHGDWVPGYVDGFSGWVAGQYLAERSEPPAVSESQWRLDVWEGVTIGDTKVRQEPTTASTSLKTIPMGTSIVVVDWVRGESVSDNQITWALLEGGGYVYARNIQRSAPVSPPSLPADAPQQGKWIDVHLTQQLMVAYEGRNPVRTVVTTTGMPGWETPPGLFSVNWRVANETMESGSIGAENFYVLKDVLFTQYFTDRGHALHYAWWKSAETIGRPGSHGCLNLLLEDAQFFWDWADIGTPVLCRTV